MAAATPPMPPPIMIALMLSVLSTRNRLRRPTGALHSTSLANSADAVRQIIDRRACGSIQEPLEQPQATSQQSAGEGQDDASDGQAQGELEEQDDHLAGLDDVAQDTDGVVPRAAAEKQEDN